MIVLRVLVTVGLVVSGVIHFQLAPGFQQAAPGGIGGGNLLRIQAVMAVLAALYVLIRGRTTSIRRRSLHPVALPTKRTPRWNGHGSPLSLM